MIRLLWLIFKLTLLYLQPKIVYRCIFFVQIVSVHPYETIQQVSIKFDIKILLWTLSAKFKFGLYQVNIILISHEAEIKLG